MKPKASISELLGSRNSYVARAANKLVTGGPLTSNEKRRLDGLMGPGQSDHLDGIYSAGPLKLIGANPGLRPGPTIEDVENLEPKLRQARQASAAAGTGTGGGAVDVIGSDGKLNKVVAHSSWTTPTAYPTLIRCEVTGSNHAALGTGGMEAIDDIAGHQCVMDYLNGLLITNGSTANTAQINVAGVATFTNASSGKKITISPTSLANDTTIDANGIKVFAKSSSNYAKISEEGLIFVYNATGTKLLTINPSLVTHDMDIREIDVCDAGVAKKMLILGSAPY